MQLQADRQHMVADKSNDAQPAPDAVRDQLTLEEAVHSQSPEGLVRAASDPALSEDLALALLNRADLLPEALEALAKNASVIKQRKVRLRMIAHRRTPRRVSLSMLRQLYAFDLMQVTLLPTTPADVKRAADEVLAVKLASASSGERLTLARRGSGRIASELLRDKEARVIEAALENPRLIEASIIKALTRHDVPSRSVERICRHPKWSLRREVRIALLWNEKTPLARALEFARSIPPTLLREILQSSRMPVSRKAYLMKASKEGKVNS